MAKGLLSDFLHEMRIKTKHYYSYLTPPLQIPSWEQALKCLSVSKTRGHGHPPARINNSSPSSLLDTA